MIKRIVLTGGPCAGKSTALSKIESYLLEKGYVVLIVAESATELIHGGIRPFGDQALYGLDFQGIILDYQLHKEQSYEQAAALLEATGRNVVILYDRGVLDNKAYLEEREWQQLLKSRNLKESDLKEHYDSVIHMVTAAKGKPEAYTLANNQARTETIEEAILLDEKTLHAWSGHPNLKIVDNSGSFSEKVGTVLEHCLDVIGDHTCLRRQQKFIVDVNKLNFSDLGKRCSESKISQFYIEHENSSYEYRVRNCEMDGQNYYSLTVQEKLENGKSKLIHEKKLSCHEYLRYLENSSPTHSIEKTRTTFLYQKEYIRFDVFQDGLVLLEIEPMTKDGTIEIPEGITILEDVTNHHSYQNRVLAKTLPYKNLTA